MLRTKAGGAEGIRTPDPHNAIVVLYQLSYDPIPSCVPAWSYYAAWEGHVKDEQKGKPGTSRV